MKSAYSIKVRRPLNFEGSGRTKQSMRDECDINQIMSKFLKTGNIEHRNTRSAQYGFATSDDFQSAMETVVTAQEMFNELPAETRKKFANSPRNFLDFVQNPDNRSEMVAMGLADAAAVEPTPPQPKEPDKAPTSPESPPPS